VILFLPSLEGGETASVIVKTLSLKPGLTAKQLYNRIKWRPRWLKPVVSFKPSVLQSDNTLQKKLCEWFTAS